VHFVVKKLFAHSFFPCTVW